MCKKIQEEKHIRNQFKEAMICHSRSLQHTLTKTTNFKGKPHRQTSDRTRAGLKLGERYMRLTTKVYKLNNSVN
eukprot:1592722-Amphidinium_carterae.1